MAGDAELADQEGAVGQVEGRGGGGRHGDAAARESEQHGVRLSAELWKGRGKAPAGIFPVLKNHAHGILFRFLHQSNPAYRRRPARDRCLPWTFQYF
ncbi:hypothetical protein GCM10009589_35320 [Arthrobacter pascens]